MKRYDKYKDRGDTKNPDKMGSHGGPWELKKIFQ